MLDFQINFKIVFCLIVVFSMLIIIGNVSATDSPSDSSNDELDVDIYPSIRSPIYSMKFLNKEAKYKQKTKLKIKLIGYDDKPIKNMKVMFCIFNSTNPSESYYLGSAKTNSKGIVTFKHKFKKFGITPIIAYPIDGSLAGDKSALVNIRVYKSTLKETNKVSVKGNKIFLTNSVKNYGPKVANFKISYKVPKGLKYLSSKVASKKYYKYAKVKYNSKKRILTVSFKNLRNKKSISFIAKFKGKSGTYLIKPVVKKSKSVKVNGNKPLNNITI